MTEVTLNGILDKLRPIQKDFICHCVREYGDRPNMHKGLLPFLPANEALRSLKYKREKLCEPNSVGLRFINGIISKIETYSSYTLFKDEATIQMVLNSSVLMRVFGKRFSKKFCITTNPKKGRPNPEGLVQLECVGKNLWLVTTEKDILNTMSLWLADVFR